MTLGEGKQKVYMLLDEWSSGGELTKDPDIELKMIPFFDTAQKRVAKVERISKVLKLTRREGKTDYPMPQDFAGLVAVWRNGEPTRRYRWKAGKLVIPESDAGVVEVEYYRTPETIPENPGDDYEFEVSDEAAELLPFYVACQNLFPDLMIDYTPYLLEWEKMLQELKEKQAERGGGLRFVNTFYRSQ